MNDATASHIGWTDSIGSANIAFSENNTTGWAQCYAIVDGSTNSTQFDGTFTGSSRSTVTLNPANNWTIGVTIIPSALTNLATFMSDDNPVFNHSGVALYEDNTGTIKFTTGQGGTYQQLSSGVAIPAQTISAFTQGVPVVAEWNASTYTMSLSVGNSNFVTKTLTGPYVAGTMGGLGFENKFAGGTSLAVFPGYLQYGFYAPTLFSQASVYALNYAFTGPVYP
jgi:hypothetical protein